MTIKDNPDIITLDLAPMESDKGWLALFWRYYSMLAGVMADNQGANDYRVELLTNLIVATIPDPEVREEMKERKKKLLDDLPIENVNERNRRTMEICMDVIGDVTTELDKSIGVCQKVGVFIE